VAGAVVEVPGAVAAGCIEAAAVLVLSADREAAARFGGRWVVVLLSVRAEVRRCVDRGAVVLL
jgi:hypothetical protein